MTSKALGIVIRTFNTMPATLAGFPRLQLNWCSLYSTPISSTQENFHG